MTQNLKRRLSEELQDSDNTMLPGPPIARETNSQTDTQRSQLARLPHELLVQIIYPILTKSEPIILLPKSRFVKTKKSTRGSAWSPLVSIVLACRAMYVAGVEVFYGQNVLRFIEALHFRKLVETRLSYDQRWAVTSMQLDVAWQRGRSSRSPWRLLHECDSCAEWRDVLEQLPKLRQITMRNTTDFKKEDRMAQLDASVFEQKMRAELGPDKAHLLHFEWPTSLVSKENN